MTGATHTIILLVFTSLGVNNVKSQGKMCCDCAVVHKGVTTNVRATIKKMKVDLTKKVISVAVWIPPDPGGGPPLLQRFSVTPLVQCGFLSNNELGYK